MWCYFLALSLFYENHGGHGIPGSCGSNASHGSKQLGTVVLIT